MKRRGLLAVIIAAMIMALSSVSAYAASLEVVSTYPEDGQKNMSMENLGVKIEFNNAVDAEAVVAANKSHVKITDEAGNTVPVKLIAEGSELLVLGDSNDENFKVDSNADYKLVLDAAFSDNDGNTLGQEKIVNFKTFNQKLNNYVSMAMMVVLMGGMMFATVKQAGGQGAAKKEEKEKDTGSKNPYREAKRTGKSVDAVVQATASKKEKKSKKAEKKEASEQAIRERLMKDPKYSLDLPYVYKVGQPRVVKRAGAVEEAAKKEQSKTRQKSGKGRKK